MPRAEPFRRSSNQWRAEIPALTKLRSGRISPFSPRVHLSRLGFTKHRYPRRRGHIPRLEGFFREDFHRRRIPQRQAHDVGGDGTEVDDVTCTFSLNEETKAVPTTAK